MCVEYLKKKALLVRRKVVEMVCNSKMGHIGGALSCVDILVALYHGGLINICPGNWENKNRDRFILSKGHACVALYPILADLGFFPTDELSTFCNGDTRLGGHPDKNLPGVEVSTGSLGQGLGIGIGMVLGSDAGKVVVLLGDGECQEGSVWEAIAFAGEHKLERLIAIVDYNGLSATKRLDIDGCSMLRRWKSFDWDVTIIDGHYIQGLVALDLSPMGRPKVIIARTTKGKGISFMEDAVQWHHGVPSKEQLSVIKKELLWI